MNDRPHIVRERRAGDSRPSDRRVVRTHRALVHALVELVGTTRYDAITIRALLERAGVGRSTFYSHYRGKDDLLLRSFEWMLEELDAGMERGDAADGRLAPARELFHHVAAMGRLHRALLRARMVDRVYQAGTARLSRTIERRLRERETTRATTQVAVREAAGRRRPGVDRPRADAVDTVPPDVAARAHAGALFALLKDWVERGMPHGPERMDAWFHALAAPPARARGR